MRIHLTPGMAAVVVAAMVLAAFGVLAWSLGARTFLRDLAISIVGAFPLAVATAILFVLVQLRSGGFLGSAGIGSVSVGLEECALPFAIIMLVEMLALRVVPFKTVLWALGAVVLADTAFVAWALMYFRPTLER